MTAEGSRLPALYFPPRGRGPLWRKINSPGRAVSELFRALGVQTIRIGLDEFAVHPVKLDVFRPVIRETSRTDAPAYLVASKLYAVGFQINVPVRLI